MKPDSKAKKSSKDLRPTTGKVREALFDILRGTIGNARFLDLYAGTGAIGIDALKEGASHVTFVEKSKHLSMNIRDLVRKKHLMERAEIINKKALTFIEWAELESLTFDIIFLDPPYHSEVIIHTLSAIGGSTILNNKGTVIAEHFSKKELPEKFDNLNKIRDYHYGDSVLSFYGKAVDDGQNIESTE